MKRERGFGLLHQKKGSPPPLFFSTNKLNPSFLSFSSKTLDTMLSLNFQVNSKTNFPPFLLVEKTNPSPIGFVVFYNANEEALSIVANKDGHWSSGA